jgi:hypothetical protein
LVILLAVYPTKIITHDHAGSGNIWLVPELDFAWSDLSIVDFTNGLIVFKGYSSVVCLQALSKPHE